MDPKVLWVGGMEQSLFKNKSKRKVKLTLIQANYYEKEGGRMGNGRKEAIMKMK